MNASTFLYPNVTSLPGQSGIGQTERQPKTPDTAVKGEFDKVFEEKLGNQGATDLSQIRNPMKFSAHASQRLKDRRIEMGPELMARINEAVDKAEAKGVEDTLILTKDAALIVNVKNRTVITAMDRSSLSGNVFTNIDGAVIV